MFGNLSRLAAHALQADTAQYQELQKNLERAGDMTEIVAVAAIVAGIAIGVFGILSLLTGNLGGIVAFALAVPIALAGYDLLKISENIGRIAEQPTLIVNQAGFGDKIDPKRLTNELAENTLFSRPIIRILIKKGSEAQ